MKHIKTAAALAAVMAAGLALTACGEKKVDNTPKPLGMTEAISIADYVLPHDDSKSSYSKSGFTTLRTLADGEWTVSSTSFASAAILAKKASDNKYYAWNYYTGDPIVEAVETLPSSVNKYVSGYGTMYFARVSKTTASGTVYDFYAIDGTAILTNSETNSVPDIAINSYYLADDVSEKTQVMCVKSGSTENYFAMNYDENGNMMLRSLNKNSIRLWSASSDKGADKFGIYQPIYDDDNVKRVYGDITEYKYINTGDEVSFYKGTEFTGKVDISKSQLRQFVGNYFYYTVQVVLADGEKGNLVDPGSVRDINYSYALHRYDIINGTDVTLNYNVVLSGIKPLYNYNNRTYDAAVISYKEVVNGVIQKDTSNYAVVDADLKVAYKLPSNVASRIDYDKLYSIDDDKYLAYGVSNGEYYVFDKDVKPLSAFASNNVAYYGKEKMFGFYDSTSSAYGFADLSGKVVIEPAYVTSSLSAPVFYGGAAVVTDKKTDKTGLLKADGTFAPLPATINQDVAKYTAYYNEEPGTYIIDIRDHAGWYVVTTDNIKDDFSHETTKVVYNYAGREITTLAPSVLSGASYNVYGNTIVIANYPMLKLLTVA